MFIVTVILKVFVVVDAVVVAVAAAAVAAAAAAGGGVSCTKKSSFEKLTVAQLVPYLLQSIKVHYTVQKRPQLVPIRSQMNPNHIFAFDFFQIDFNRIIPS
jgi:hypothetical protein